MDQKESPTSIAIGQYHTLEVIKILDFGLYLAHGLDEILLPIRYIPEGTQVGDKLYVFIYRDSEDRVIATTEKPLATANSFACLRVTDANSYGVFLDWGLVKDLFMPFSEQHKKLIPGRNYLVWVYVDPETDRVMCSARLEKFLQTDTSALQENQLVELLIWEFTDMGIKVVVEQKYSGVLYHNEVFETLYVGDQVNGYIKKIREDGKLDVVLRKKGYAEVIDAKEEIMQQLKKSQGFLPLTDNSSPQEIYERLQMSKKTFKKAVGGLLKDGQLSLSKDGIYFIEPE
ncbi:GntR family transcriptional regulator [Rhodocytophaga rosea]|uniref:GntR family transcriptional regulator n=1 Tax=Rhodocytophaga rosea TaxID=2704465 RepID=A0A6C0GSS5_9BACT|nr:S1-like domain-containing RNA-binding protein [Rhodocytophaga rosea]QHT71198.1 GntR family transcriptional regulator [Rhodocytophaga rosea]